MIDIGYTAQERAGFWLDPNGTVGGVEYVNVIDADWNPVEYDVPREQAERDYPEARYGRLPGTDYGPMDGWE